MKKNTATWCVGLIAAVTLAMTFSQPTVIHQLVVWVSGLFAVVMVLALFVVGNWPDTSAVSALATNKPTADEVLILTVQALRNQQFSDFAISSVLKTDIDVIKAIP